MAAARADIAGLERKLDRYLHAFEDGQLDPAVCQQRIQRHHTRLEALRAQEADLTQALATLGHTAPDTAEPAGLADQLDEIVANRSPEQAKELLRLLVKEIRVHDRRRIMPTYRVPAAVRAIRRKVEGTWQRANHPQFAAPAVGTR